MKISMRVDSMRQVDASTVIVGFSVLVDDAVDKTVYKRLPVSIWSDPDKSADALVSLTEEEALKRGSATVPVAMSDSIVQSTIGALAEKQGAQKAVISFRPPKK